MTTVPPPFPADVSSHPLLIVDYQLVKIGNRKEIDKLWEAATQLGFWYLKNHGADVEVQGMLDMGAETMKLPLDEKLKFEQGDDGHSFGYKAAGANAVDDTGLLDSVEYINVSKDDALAWPQTVHRTYPSPVNTHMETTIKPFTQKAVDVNMTMLRVFNDKLGLPQGTLANLHRMYELSCSESRCIRKAPAPEQPPDQQALGAHTDFGSLSFLHHNMMGGLQGSVPLPGHAVCNVGDALALFSGGVLRSNIHRVVPPPKEQAAFERWSLVFFTRPANDVELRALTEQSSIIAEAVENSPDPSKFSTLQTAQSWYYRRTKYQRVKNRTGPESWHQSRGTEHNEQKAFAVTAN
ncbi:hypothetical protein PHLGIDRAFT_105488 [Phlebiopsis gigantea 11061_1 CR5-6]|uniref:Fe2OG dioxygenase domain-containing protein n=1 Tax=Phlebiopsis gigantea (strain 11061_1 CR5-6) TaxID=745531 RepID=A0A0C3PLV4_PHLG1|nr:hypothetical protein PHLGIDRAFT_105488 [Phlebiopsis gigantea 11061_1 CR5-6]